MAKRHYSSGKKHSGGKSIDHHDDHFNDEIKHDRDHERGMYRKGLTSGELYAGMEPRRRQELEDAGMIHEDHSAIANLPQQVMIKPYPKVGPYNPEVLDDTILGVDGQIHYDDKHRAMHFYPKKV